MEKHTCPMCGQPVIMLDVCDAFDVPGRVVTHHLVKPGAQTPTWNPSPAVCLAVGLTLATAQDVADDRQAGVHLRAHP